MRLSQRRRSNVFYGSLITVMYSIPVWSMTSTAVFTLGSGNSNGMVLLAGWSIFTRFFLMMTS